MADSFGVEFSSKPDADTPIDEYRLPHVYGLKHQKIGDIRTISA